MPFLFAFVMLLSSCATGGGKTPAANSAPQWVADPHGAFPESEWLCVVEPGGSRQEAQNAAAAALAKAFKIDVKTVTAATRTFREARENGVEQFSQNKDFSEDIETSSEISSLLGVIHDFYGSGGLWYASARMNRREGTVRYTARIQEYDRVIASLKAEAAAAPATFEAYEALVFAGVLAVLADSEAEILSVLDYAARERLHADYGSAAGVEALAASAARSIVINVSVAGDETGRIAAAFAQVFSERGFRSAVVHGDAAYTLAASFVTEEVAFAGNANKFARYSLSAALKNAGGIEVLSFSSEGREGHTSFSEANHRALRTAEQLIATTGFAASFDAWLSQVWLASPAIRNSNKTKDSTR
jgi:hypothetical protein